MTSQADRAQNCGGSTTVLGDLQTSSLIQNLGIVSSLEQGIAGSFSASPHCKILWVKAPCLGPAVNDHC